MKKIILIGIGGLFLGLPIAGKVFAVWPPSTELEEEANAASSAAATQNMGAEMPRPRGLAERFDEDERQLKQVVQNLQKDEEDLKKSLHTEKPNEHQ